MCDSNFHSVSGDRKIIDVLDPNLYPEYISFLTSKINRNDKSCPEIRFLFYLGISNPIFGGFIFYVVRCSRIPGAMLS